MCNWGDLAMLSFHATKVFNTFEGGALITNDAAMKERIDHLRNFGFTGETTVVAPGSNGKVDEMRSAFGLLQLKHVDEEIAKRQKVASFYREHLKDVPGIRILHDLPGVRHNYGYFPILVDAKTYGLTRDVLYEKLKAHNILSRRYFYPLCSQFPTYRNLPSALAVNLSVAERTAQEVLCLPIYADMENETLEKIAALVRSMEK